MFTQRHSRTAQFEASCKSKTTKTATPGNNPGVAVFLISKPQLDARIATMLAPPVVVGLRTLAWRLLVGAAHR